MSDLGIDNLLKQTCMKPHIKWKDQQHELLTRKEAAAFLGVPVSVMVEWETWGDRRPIEYKKKGRKRLYLYADLVKLLNKKWINQSLI